MKNNFVCNFLKYVSYDTTAGEPQENKASCENQYVLGQYLVEQLKKYNPDILQTNKFGTIHAVFKSKQDSQLKNSICLLAHMDTSPSCGGCNIKSRIIEKYDGKVIKLNDATALDPNEFPSLNRCLGHSLIVTDGTTLLGGDDKAGIAIIMDLLANFDKNTYKHSLEILFTTDEEIGVDAFHVDLDKLVSKYGYTIDGGDILYISNENFNAYSMVVTVKGISIHPGSAKDKMINAINVAMDFHNKLPKDQRPEHTEHKQGFYHLLDIRGNEELTTLTYIIRDFDLNELHKKIDYAKQIAENINKTYNKGYDIVELSIEETYLNMKEALNKNPHIVQNVIDSYKRLNLEYKMEAIRGGTTGAHLSFMGLPCANLGTGDYNCHGRYEFVDVDQALKMVEVLIDLFNN